jgi:hypothetical protein
MTPDIDPEQARTHPAASAIETAAAELNRLREAWLYPDDQINTVTEPVSEYLDRAKGQTVAFPVRRISKNDEAGRTLAERTLTRLYNDMPTWLVEAHAALDSAVAAAYGWPADIEEQDALARLLELNLTRRANS